MTWGNDTRASGLSSRQLVGARPFLILSFPSLPQLLVAGGECGELISQLWEDQEGMGLLSIVCQALIYWGLVSDE